MNEVELKKAIESSNHKKSILIWGACKENDVILNMFRIWEFDVVGYIDRRYTEIQKFNNKPVYSTDKLSSNEYFVYVGLKGYYPEIIEKLIEYNYKEFVDFWYPSKLIQLDGTKNYKDRYGNMLDTRNTQKVKVILRDGGKCILGKGRYHESCRFIAQRNGELNIEDGVSLAEKSEVCTIGGKIRIAKNVKIGHDCMIRATCGGETVIEENCTIQFMSNVISSLYAKIYIGKDCMLSYAVFIRAGNSHNIMDLSTGENLNKNEKRNVILGEHVWCGMRSTIFSGCQIGNGSIVGANTFVNKKFPNNCCIVGNPARIVRKSVAWIRDGRAIHEDPSDYDAFIYEENMDYGRE